MWFHFPWLYRFGSLFAKPSFKQTAQKIKRTWFRQTSKRFTYQIKHNAVETLLENFQVQKQKTFRWKTGLYSLIFVWQKFFLSFSNKGVIIALQWVTPYLSFRKPAALKDSVFFALTIFSQDVNIYLSSRITKLNNHARYAIRTLVMSGPKNVSK